MMGVLWRRAIAIEIEVLKLVDCYPYIFSWIYGPSLTAEVKLY